MGEKMYSNIDTEISLGIYAGAERDARIYPVIYRYLKNKIAGWNIGDFFNTLKKKNIAIYAVTEFADLMIDDLKAYDKDISVKNICDKNHINFPNSYKGINVVSIDVLVEQYIKKAIDIVVICSLFHENEIFDELVENNIEMRDIVSIVDIIFSI